MSELIIGVIGTGESSLKAERIAEEVGSEIAKNGAILINGGLGGVMEASARGAKRNGGTTIGILPGMNPLDANRFIDVAIPTGMGDMRNILIVRASKAIIAINGSYGTLSELAIALKHKKPVIGIDTWNISRDIIRVTSALEAVNKAIDEIDKFTI
jgi:uncharacterized protein (TIGR00725 family)